MHEGLVTTVDVLYVPSDPSFPCVSVFGLLTGCYALASLTHDYQTVDCLLPGLLCCSALSPR